jgi:N-alpha-acetyltransferase 10/11
MGASLTLLSVDGSGHQARLPPDYIVRPCDRSDAAPLGAVYFDAYDPGIASATLQEAVDDIEASFAGSYGALWDEGTRLVTREDVIVAAVLTVSRAPWDDVPDCPFIIELFTARAHRRRGLAAHLVGEVLAAAAQVDEAGVALRVERGNRAAIELYASLGFVPWNDGS